MAKETGVMLKQAFDKSSMTRDEKEILVHLISAWNIFVNLPHEHNDDNNEFRHGIHMLQMQIMARPTRRQIREWRQ